MNLKHGRLFKDESKEYIQTKLRGVRCTMQVLTKMLLKLWQMHPMTFPSCSTAAQPLLNQLVNSCLMIASAKNSDMVDSKIVMQAVTDYELV